MSKDCFHCGLPVPREITLTVKYQGERESVCCHGCQSVASMIIDGGLNAYYNHREKPAQRPDEEAIEWQIYDNEGVQASFVIPDGDAKRVTLLVDGITCSACAWLIEKALSELNGISSARVNASTKRLDFIWDEEQIALSTVLTKLSAYGYTAGPWSHSSAAEASAKESRSLLFKLGLSGIAFLQVMMFAVALYAGDYSGIQPEYQSLMRWFSLAISIPVIFYSATPFFEGAWRSIKAGGLSMDVPVAVAISLAWLASIWATVGGHGEVYFDSVVMFTFFLLTGRYLELKARHAENMDRYELSSWLPKSALRLQADGVTSQTIPTRQLQLNDHILVRQGDQIAADGIVIAHHATVDESLLTGEQRPVLKGVGAEVFAGTTLVDGHLTVEVTSLAEQSQAAVINQMVENAASQKPPLTLLVDRISGIFIACVLLSALIVGVYWSQHRPEDAFWIALSMLVVTCPCALSLATPVAITSAIKGFRKRGVLITESAAIEKLAQVDQVIFDKTGTLTTGLVTLKHVSIFDDAYDRERAVAIAAALEQASNHPIAHAFGEASKSAINSEIVIGKGVLGTVEGVHYKIGSGVFVSSAESLEPGVYLASDKGLIAHFVMSDEMRPGTTGLVSALAAKGVDCHLLSGDRAEPVQQLATELSIPNVKAEASPEFKLSYLRELRTRGFRALMVGDGLNDVPVLGGAYLSMAMSQGASLARCHADMVISGEQLVSLPALIAFARKARKVIRQNLSWALVYNLFALPLAALGYVPPWAAAIGMSLSSLVVVLNALRLSR